MTSYPEFVKQDVHYHDTCNAPALWPPFISELVRSMQNVLKIPSWLRSDSVQYTDERVIHLLGRLRASDDMSNVDLWDNTDMEERQCIVFNTALADCARIRAVVETENLTDTLFPKESFLVVLVRNAMFNAYPQLSSLEDVHVVLPRHSSGEAIPILRYMVKSLCAPLVVSIPQRMPVKERTAGSEHDTSDKNEDSIVESKLFKHPPPSLSEWLNGSNRNQTPTEVEEEEEARSSQFEAYFLQSFPSATPPSICHIPVLCMADEDQLPVLMSSLLYQRHVWRISNPLVGIGFSKYDTTIRLFLGWLEDDLSSGRILPRIHLGEIGTPIKLDLSSPSAALVVARFLCGLEQHMYTTCDTVRHTVAEVISVTQSRCSSLSWRIDTNVRNEGCGPLLEDKNTHDKIIRWLQGLRYSESDSQMVRGKKTPISSLGSGTSAPPPQKSTFTYPASASSDSSALQSSRNQERHETIQSVPTFESRLSCSDFATTSEDTDMRVFRWMFDRRVVPRSVPSDMKFREEYSAMTGLIWPETWCVREDLPSIDVALEPCVQELLESVATLKEQPGAVKCIPEKDFPVDLRVLEQSFSAIFQASRRCHEKTKLQETIPEVAWRHDHDRLLYDFFIHLVQPKEGDAARLPEGRLSITDLEDPLSRPTLETTLRFPKSDCLQRSGQLDTTKQIRTLIRQSASDLDSWLEARGGSLEAMAQEDRHTAYVLSQFGSWTLETGMETESQTISKLGQSPSKGKCDALGRLLVELPKIPVKAIGDFPLVARAAGKDGGNKRRNEIMGKQPSKVSSKLLTVPKGSPTGMNGKQYSILSSAFRASTASSGDGEIGSVDALVFEAQDLQLGPDVTRLELPIIAAEYKKVSENAVKGTNQLRMYLTASVKFLQAIGITNFPVYGVQTDGPTVALPFAVLRDDNFVHLFERLVEALDISKPLGAWHYATILCRLAQNHTRVLELKFDEVKEDLITSLLQNGKQMEGWTLDGQMGRLKVENKAKLSLRESKK